MAPAYGEEPKLRFDVDFLFGNVNDNCFRYSFGRERVSKVGYAVLGASADLSPHLSYRLELNGVNDSAKPEPFTPTEKTPFFYPNLADSDYGVVSKPEGRFNVDDYYYAGWDPYIQEHSLRRAYVDIHDAKRNIGLVVGRFFPRIGLPLDRLRWFTAKDLTHIERINNRIDVGAELYWRFDIGQGRSGRLALAAVGGNGNPYHDYAYFDFTRGAQEDTNSAVSGVGSIMLQPLDGLTAMASYEYNHVGSRVEVSPTLARSKHHDDKLTLGLMYRPASFKHVELFGEWAKYKWGLRDSSAAILPGPRIETPIDKRGYNAGIDLSLPLPRDKGKVGVIVIREELDRDDSLVAFLAARGQLDARPGEKERATIFKAYAEIGPLTVFFFQANIDNPFPALSAIVPIAGDSAGDYRGSNKTGFGIRLMKLF